MIQWDVLRYYYVRNMRGKKEHAWGKKDMTSYARKKWGCLVLW